MSKYFYLLTEGIYQPSPDDPGEALTSQELFYKITPILLVIIIICLIIIISLLIRKSTKN